MRRSLRLQYTYINIAQFVTKDVDEEKDLTQSLKSMSIPSSNSLAISSILPAFAASISCNSIFNFLIIGVIETDVIASSARTKPPYISFSTKLCFTRE